MNDTSVGPLSGTLWMAFVLSLNLIERSEFRDSNMSFKYNEDLDHMTLIDNSSNDNNSND